GPLRIGGRVDTLVHRRGGALEHVELLGTATEVRHQLDAGRAGADQCDALVRQFVQSAVRVTTGVVVIPSRGVEHMAGEVFDAGDAGQLRAVVRALRHDDESRPDLVAPVGADLPALRWFVPTQ